MYVIGLTGGIASGKSTAAKALREMGATVIDADATSHALTAPGGSAAEAIQERFGTLDRRALGRIVFSDDRARRDLNAIVHPLVRREMQREIYAATTPVVVLDVPLLYESGMESMADEVWVVYAPRQVQAARIMARDDLPREAAEARIDSQMPTEEKLARADVAIDTSGPLSRTREVLEEHWTAVTERLKAAERARDTERTADTDLPKIPVQTGVPKEAPASVMAEIFHIQDRMERPYEPPKPVARTFWNAYSLPDAHEEEDAEPEPDVYDAERLPDMGDVPPMRRRRADRHRRGPHLVPINGELDEDDTLDDIYFETAEPEPDAWDDTSTVLEAPEQWSFFHRQPPLFWVVAGLLLVLFLIVAGVVGVQAWRDAEAERAEAARLQQLAEEKARYRLEYRDLIESYAYERGLDPAFVAAVIYNESRFDPEAVSRVGARGLMQIMEETGQWIAEKLDETDGYTFDRMFTPETNIRFGTWYLAFLAREFDGDIVKMAAGYHAGQGAVRSWLNNPEYSADGVTLDHIPYPDTEQYVQRVVNAYAIYTRHYYTPESTETTEPSAA